MSKTNTDTKTTAIAASGIVAAVVAGILSIGVAFADNDRDAITGASQFTASAVPVQTSVGANHGISGIRQVAQPQSWMQIITDDTQRR
ncbi:MAG TPA: hypothetical protein VL574_16705 [Stellaceae bacterium]|jgi:hypothetical protein|nr:hypothetical protein [Stellaceae bacterium]